MTVHFPAESRSRVKRIVWCEDKNSIRSSLIDCYNLGFVLRTFRIALALASKRWYKMISIILKNIYNGTKIFTGWFLFTILFFTYLVCLAFGGWINLDNRNTQSAVNALWIKDCCIPNLFSQRRRKISKNVRNARMIFLFPTSASSYLFFSKLGSHDIPYLSFGRTPAWVGYFFPFGNWTIRCE